MADKILLSAYKDSQYREFSHVSEDIEQLKNNIDALVDRAYEYLEINEYLSALELLSYCLSSDTEDPEILNGIGVALCELGKLDESKMFLERAIRYHPGDALSYANLAGVYWEFSDYEKAIYCYKKSIDLEPEMSDSYYNLTNLYAEIGLTYMAFITCNEFITKFPDDPEGQELMDDVMLDLALSIY
jgi:tetratricopeptide (TPR) repeat protein